jgi:hypothetical protein
MIIFVRYFLYVNFSLQIIFSFFERGEVADMSVPIFWIFFIVWVLEPFLIFLYTPLFLYDIYTPILQRKAKLALFIAPDYMFPLMCYTYYTEKFAYMAL